MIADYRLVTTVSFAAVLLLSCQSRSFVAARPAAEFARDGIPVNWGTLDPSPLPVGGSGNPGREAALANAAAAALNRAAILPTLLDGLPADTKMLDGIASAPLHFLSNDDDPANHPFGDGQKNASFNWPSWSGSPSRPPALFTLTRADGGAGIGIFHVFIVEVAAGVFPDEANRPERVRAQIADDSSKSVPFEVVKDAARGVYRGIFVLGRDPAGISAKQSYPAAIGAAPAWLLPLTDRYAWPRIKLRFEDRSLAQSASGWMPVLFRFPIQPRQLAIASLPQDQRLFNGRPISDPPYDPVEGVAAVTRLSQWYEGQAPDARVADFFGSVAGSGVHSQFKDSTGMVTKTATGGVDTYVLKSLIGNNQVLYTCFDARNPASEAQLGVPSGAGWHSIGHPIPGDRTFAETVVNGFEKSGIFAAWGVRTPNPFEGDAAFGAKDVATFRVLRSGEAFTTAQGHFHWYAVDASQKVCATIWKHLRCELRSDRDLKCKE